MVQRFDIQQQITEEIVQRIEEGGLPPWKCPWTKTGESPIPYNYATKQGYNGMNILLLWMRAAEKGFSRNAWLTFNQAKSLGARVRKGEKSVRCIFYKPLEVEDEDAKGKRKRLIPLLRYFSVFNVEQIDDLDLPEIETKPRFVEYEPVTLLEEAAESIQLSEIVYGGDRAFYSPNRDFIELPASFHNASSHATTLAHELIHATGHKSRLDRFENLDVEGLGKSKKEAYAFEELIAEIGASFVCSELGIEGQHEQHASYLDFWLKHLKSDKSFLFKAAARASKAHGILLAEKIERPDISVSVALSQPTQPCHQSIAGL